ncbi:unnamed protein product [Linum trigynum]|uniref:Homogentisate geranylgeranyl transferase n=1 Tax=Linum trigynum TaxID=586398 RepID=A0AAV2DP93_9ROSI
MLCLHNTNPAHPFTAQFCAMRTAAAAASSHLVTLPSWHDKRLHNNLHPACCVKLRTKDHHQVVAMNRNKASKFGCNSTTRRICRRCNRQVVFSKAGVSLQEGFGSFREDEGSWHSSLTSGVVEKLEAFYRFSRPHTVIGTVIGITSVSLLPLQTSSEIFPAFVLGLIKAVVPSVCMNIYVVGLNQLFDVEIDKVNKPTLPLASGEFSMATGVTIVAASLITSFYLGVKFQSPPLLAALLISFLLGSAYSVELPLMRWKRHAFLAASCILIVRAVVVQLAFFIHMQKFVLGKPVAITRTLVFATAFMCFFSAVIALFKDIPDLDGDRDFGIQSFTVKLGQEKVFWVCVQLLLVAYGAGVLMGFSSPCLSSKIITVAGHSTLAVMLWLQAQSVDLTTNTSITSFYMFIWKLFYAEYFLIPFIR